MRGIKPAVAEPSFNAYESSDSFDYSNDAATRPAYGKLVQDTGVSPVVFGIVCSLRIPEALSGKSVDLRSQQRMEDAAERKKRLKLMRDEASAASTSEHGWS